ncbi:MAG: hypothetical protein L6R36_002302 [Xanthoria steineri]|nr:MAG: hypothetical protein L6R36_002302 [Xanthoria steineri]
MASPSATLNRSPAIASDTQSTTNPSISPLTSTTPDHYRVTTSSRPVHKTRPSSSSVSSVLKTKKRVPWRGKTCIISLPSSHSKSDFKKYADGRPSLVLPDPEVRTRPSFPDPEETIAERAERSFRIRLPDKTLWDAYVKGLQEAKLLALGVSPGHEDIRAQPLSRVSPLSWRTSPQTRSLPVSPSIAPPYSTECPMKLAYGVPSRSQDTYNLGLRASTMDYQIAQPSVKHFPRYSISNFRQSPEIHSPNSLVGPNVASFPTFDGDVLPLYPSTSTAEILSTCSPKNNFLSQRSGDRPSGPNRQQMTRQSERQHECQEGPPQSYDLWTVDSSNDEPTFQYPAPRSYRNSLPEVLEGRLYEAEGNCGAARDLGPIKVTEHQTGNLARAGKLDPIESSKTTSSLENVENSRHREEAGEFPNKTVLSASGLNALAPAFRTENSSAPCSSSVASTAMRPTAPVFTPASMTQQLPASHDFTFLSTGPIFKPLPDIVRPAKSSKAIDIRTPKDEWSMSTPNGEVQEDESGRITQAEGRQKRQRRASEDGLQEARFPSGVHATSSTADQYSALDDLNPSNVSKHQHGRHGSESLEKATQAANQLKEIIDDLSTSEDSSSLAQAAENADPDGAASTSRDTAAAVACDIAQTRSPPGQAHLPQTSFSGQQGTAAELPIKCGFSPECTSNAVTRSQSEDETSHQHSEALCKSRSSVTQHDSKSSDSDALGKKSVERSALEVASLLNKDSIYSTQKLTDDVADGMPSIDSSFGGSEAAMKHLNNGDPTSATNDEDLLPSCQIPNRIGVHDFQDPKTGLHQEQNLELEDLSQTFQYLPPIDAESVNSSVVRLVAENARFSPSYRPSYASDGPFPANCLGSAESAAISEWGKAVSSSEASRLDHEKAVLEACVNHVVGKVLEDRLMPLEQSLACIRNSFLELAKQTPNRTDQPKTPGNVDSSDADDEDDIDYTEPITRSPNRDRKTEKLKAMMSDVLATQPKCVPANELETIVATMKELKNLVQEIGPHSADVKSVVEEAVGRQMRGRSGPITSSHQSATVEKSQLQIAGLESMLKIAEGRAEDEMRARRATEDALADSQRLLRLALQDAAEQRESAEETEQSLSAFHEERHELLRRNALLEGAQDSFHRTASELTEKNTALEGTLKEYRLSSAQWREEIESAQMENKDLRRTVNALRTEMQEGIDGRQVLRAKFARLQEEMAAVSQSIAQDQSLWRIKEEEYKARCEIMIADGRRQSQRCEDMSTEITALSERLQLSEHKHHQATAELERQLDDQIERVKMERDRVQNSMDNESRTMASKLDDARVTSEGIVANIKSQLDQATKAANTDRVIFEQQLQKEAASGAAAIESLQAFHDQVVGGLRDQNEELELQCRDRLKLAEEKISLYQEKIGLLEEKLEVAKSAAQAAVQAVQSNRSTSKGRQPGHSIVPGSVSSPPAKTSPQALRESILVLQEQLQDREMQIEELEHRLAAIDTEAPVKMKAQETEITWLRELLSVRLDDLEDLIAALSRPVHDGEAIKDVAIRLKANIEMEQQEKERAHQGSQSFPSLAAISHLTSSPRFLPLAAAAAWGNWQKGRIAPVRNFFGSASGHTPETPSRISPSTQSKMSALMTPSHTEVQASGGDSKGFKPPSWTSSTAQQRAAFPRRDGGLRSRGPVTPSLTRRSNDDMDADNADVVQLHGTVNGSPGGETGQGEVEETFGPRIAAFSGHL